MDTTENLNLPYLMPSQAQKHVTHNEALRAIDALLHLAVLSRNVAEPPTSPTPGQRYIVPEGATGAWTGQTGKVAAWQDDAWMLHQPRAGWLAYALDEEAMLAFSDGAWQVATFRAAISDMIGINASADATNRLALASAASLFNHDGAGHQIKINKAQTTDTASLLFQSGFSGRAEFGLAGDDDFHVKVSADGAAFTEAMTIDGATGRASFPAGVAGMRAQLTADRTYHVGNAGSDADDGLSAGTAFATLQKAVDAAHALDCSIHDVTIQIADGSYAGAAVERPLLGGGLLSIVGNVSAPSAVVLTSGISVAAARVSVTGVKLEMAANWIHALSAREAARLIVGAVEFGQAGANAYHIYANSPAHITLEEGYTISGGAARHIGLTGPIILEGTNCTINLIGTPDFGQEFLYVANGAGTSLWNLTISGAATGRRYLATSNAVINLYGKPTDFLPGDVVGAVSSGAVYV